MSIGSVVFAESEVRQPEKQEKIGYLQTGTWLQVYLMCYSFLESNDSVQTQHVILQSLGLRMQRYGKLTEENISGGTDMGKSTVYFTDFRSQVGTSQQEKLKKLCIAAGIKDIDMDGKFVAI